MGTEEKTLTSTAGQGESTLFYQGQGDQGQKKDYYTGECNHWLWMGKYIGTRFLG